MERTELRVEFGNVTIGDQTARLGVKIAREELPLADADRLFCGRRIWGVVSLAEPGDEDQQRLPTMEDNRPSTIEDAFETKQLGVRPNEYSIGLNFNLKSIDVQELARFAKKSGTVAVVSVQDIDHERTPSDEGWRHEEDRENEDPHGEENRQAYAEGCEASAAGKKRRCPYKEGDGKRAYWLRGYDETQVSGADMRHCIGCETDYDGNEHDACPACGETNFVRLETSETEAE